MSNNSNGGFMSTLFCGVNKDKVGNWCSAPENRSSNRNSFQKIRESGNEDDELENKWTSSLQKKDAAIRQKESEVEEECLNAGMEAYRKTMARLRSQESLKKQGQSQAVGGQMRDFMSAAPDADSSRYQGNSAVLPPFPENEPKSYGYPPLTTRGDTGFPDEEIRPVKDSEYDAPKQHYEEQRITQDHRNYRDNSSEQTDDFRSNNGFEVNQGGYNAPSAHHYDDPQRNIHRSLPEEEFEPPQKSQNNSYQLSDDSQELNQVQSSLNLGPMIPSKQDRNSSKQERNSLVPPNKNISQMLRTTERTHGSRKSSNIDRPVSAMHDDAERSYSVHPEQVKMSAVSSNQYSGVWPPRDSSVRQISLAPVMSEEEARQYRLEKEKEGREEREREMLREGRRQEEIREREEEMRRYRENVERRNKEREEFEDEENAAAMGFEVENPYMDRPVEERYPSKKESSRPTETLGAGQMDDNDSDDSLFGDLDLSPRSRKTNAHSPVDKLIDLKQRDKTLMEPAFDHSEFAIPADETPEERQIRRKMELKEKRVISTQAKEGKRNKRRAQAIIGSMEPDVYGEMIEILRIVQELDGELIESSAIHMSQHDGIYPRALSLKRIKEQLLYEMDSARLRELSTVEPYNRVLPLLHGML